MVAFVKELFSISQITIIEQFIELVEIYYLCAHILYVEIVLDLRSSLYTCYAIKSISIYV